jgi:hypothetical protein
MSRYDYTLTEVGKQIAEDKTGRWPNEWDLIIKAIRRLKTAYTADYVRLAIAAKTDLLSRESGSSLSPESLKAKTAEHGWKAFTDEQYADAMNFLKAVFPHESQPTTV